MDASARESIKRAATTAVAILLLLALVAWVVPGIFATLSGTESEVVDTPKVSTLSAAEVDLFLEDALKRLGTTSVIQREEEDLSLIHI